MSFPTCRSFNRHFRASRGHRWCALSNVGCGKTRRVVGRTQFALYLYLSPGQMKSEPFTVIEPRSIECESGRLQQLIHHGKRVFITVFGVNALAFTEPNTQIE